MITEPGSHYLPLSGRDLGAVSQLTEEFSLICEIMTTDSCTPSFITTNLSLIYCRLNDFIFPVIFEIG